MSTNRVSQDGPTEKKLRMPGASRLKQGLGELQGSLGTVYHPPPHRLFGGERVKEVEVPLYTGPFSCTVGTDWLPDHRGRWKMWCEVWLSGALGLSTGSREQNKSVASPASLRSSPSGSDGELEFAAFPSLPAES